MILALRALVLVGGALVLLGIGVGQGASKPRRQLIAFWSDQGGYAGVWVMRTDGSGRRLLTGKKTRAKRGDFSPSGRRIVFDGQPKRGETFDFDIQVIGVNGHRRRRLTHGKPRDTEPRWSPDGSTIVFQRQEREFSTSALWTVSAHGGKPQLLGPGLSPAWSPSGTKLLFALRNERFGADIYVMRNDGTRVRLLHRSRDDDYPAAWSRGGSILITRVSRSRPHADVYTLRSNGQGLHRLTRCRSFCYAADFSPSGRRVLYTRVKELFHSERGQVFVMNRDGSHARNLSRNLADENAASWSR